MEQVFKLRQFCILLLFYFKLCVVFSVCITCFDPHLIAVRGMHLCKCSSLLYMLCGPLKYHVSVFLDNKRNSYPYKRVHHVEVCSYNCALLSDSFKFRKSSANILSESSIGPSQVFTIIFLKSWSSCFMKKPLEKKSFTYTIFSSYYLFSTQDLSTSNEFGLLKVNGQFRGQIGIVSSG